MVTDYEAAWSELAEVIAARPTGWGTKNLLAEMTAIATRHRVSETLVERVVRLYGGRIVLSASNQEESSSARDGSTPAVERADPPPIEDRGDRDGTADRREPVNVG